MDEAPNRGLGHEEVTDRRRLASLNAARPSSGRGLLEVTGRPAPSSRLPGSQRPPGRLAGWASAVRPQAPAWGHRSGWRPSSQRGLAGLAACLF